MGFNGREAALKALLEFEERADKAGDALDRALLQGNPEPRETALAARIFYGVIQNRTLLDFYISGFSDIKISKISPLVLSALRIGIYQLNFLDRIPKSAAVDTSVKLVKRFSNPRAVSFANAVLRKASISPMPALPASEKDAYLSLKYSHPAWLVKRFIALFGESDAEKLLYENNRPAPVYFRVNTLKLSADEAEAVLKESGIGVKRHPYADNCFTAENIGNPDLIEAVRQGLVYVQDASSQLSVAALCPTPGSRVIDICAAPGGKSFLCAQFMKNEGQILSFDINNEKTGMIKSGAQRLGASIINAELSDALSLREDLISYADFIVCDVPCSGFGVIRKKPDIRFKRPEETASLPLMQKRILENAAHYLKPGGALIYSTCTVFPEENEDIVKSFLNAHPEFKLEPYAAGTIRSSEGMTLLLPFTFETDGFFFAKIRKTDG